jgi:hypothetical protein
MPYPVNPMGIFSRILIQMPDLISSQPYTLGPSRKRAVAIMKKRRQAFHILDEQTIHGRAGTQINGGFETPKHSGRRLSFRNLRTIFGREIVSLFVARASPMQVCCAISVFANSVTDLERMIDANWSGLKGIEKINGRRGKHCWPTNWRFGSFSPPPSSDVSRFW